MKTLLMIALTAFAFARLQANEAPTAWLFVDSPAGAASVGQIVTVRTSVADYDNGWIGRHLYYKSPTDTDWVGWSFEGVAGNEREPGNPNSSAEWDRLWNISVGQSGVWQFMVKAYDPGAGNGLGYDRWSNEAVGSITVGATTNTAPSTVSASATNVTLGQAATLTGRAMDVDGNLALVQFYVTGPGMPGWNFLQNVPVSGADATATMSWAPPSAGSWTLHIRAGDTAGLPDSNGNITAGFTVSSQAPAYSFKILVDTNELKGSEAAALIGNPAGTFLAPDGVWNLHTNSDSALVPSGDGVAAEQWAPVLQKLNAPAWTVSEDVYGFTSNQRSAFDIQIARRTESLIGRRVDQAMVYREPLAGSSFQNTLSPTSGVTGDPANPTDEIKDSADYMDIQSPVAGGRHRIVVHARSYVSDAATAVEQALQHPDCVGVCFEMVPASGDWHSRAYINGQWVANAGGSLRSSNINAGIVSCLNKGKKCYLLLPARGTLDDATDSTAASQFGRSYLAEIQNTLRYINESGRLNDPNLFIVLAVYGRWHADNPSYAGFIVGDGATGADNSIKSALDWLRALRNGQVSLP